MSSSVKVNEAINANIKRIKDIIIEDLDNDDDTLVRTSNDVTALTALGETNVADITNTATGTEIATAVNGILAILVAAGLMDAGA